MQGVGPHRASASTFATYLETRAKEEATAAKLGRSIFSANHAAPIGTDSAGGDVGETNPLKAVNDALHGSEEGGERAETGSDEVAVGRDATLDPMMQVIGALAPRIGTACATVRPEAPSHPEARTSMEQLMARLVRRVAWSGNGRTGVARLELGAGELEGATLTIQADDGLVRVALDLPPGVDRAEWKVRISERLALRGLQVEAVDVA
jgi:hypothetical protein